MTQRRLKIHKPDRRIAAFRYSQSGGSATWADRAYPNIFPNAARTFSHDAATFTTRYLQSDGIAF